MKKISLVAFALFTVSNSIAQTAHNRPLQRLPEERTHYSEAITAKIKQVEEQTGLVRFKVAGQPERVLTETMRAHGVKGLSIAVINDFKIEWAKGYGWADEATQQPVSRETCFEPGSISKSLNALGVLKLVQDGRLDPDADINNYLKSWKFPYDSITGSKKITTRQLLSHTAGLNVHGFPGYFKGDTLPSVIDILNGKAPANTEPVRSVAPPGIAFRYSGGGIMISQQLLTDISGQSYDLYMQQQVLQPLGMNHSFFTQPAPESKKHMLATGYDLNGKAMRGNYPILPEQAAAGLWTTAEDLARYVIGMQLSLQDETHPVLHKAMTQYMLSPYIDSSVGLGVFIEARQGMRYFKHSAANQGFRGIYIGSFEEGKGLVVLVNSDNDEILEELMQSVARVYHWKGMAQPLEPVAQQVVKLPLKDLEKYTGTYLQGTTIVCIEQKDEILCYQAGGKKMKMYFTAPGHFFNLESGAEKEFYSDKDGRIAGFIKKNGATELGRMEKVIPPVLKQQQLAQYAGTYTEPDSNKVLVSQSGNDLYINPGNGAMKMNFISEQVFYLAEDFGAIYTFDISPDGNSTGITGRKGAEQKVMRKLP